MYDYYATTSTTVAFASALSTFVSLKSPEAARRIPFPHPAPQLGRPGQQFDLLPAVAFPFRPTHADAGRHLLRLRTSRSIKPRLLGNLSDPTG
jgi:hypothetical protein